MGDMKSEIEAMVKKDVANALEKLNKKFLNRGDASAYWEMALLDYYSEYHPLVYQRQYQLENALVNNVASYDEGRLGYISRPSYMHHDKKRTGETESSIFRGTAFGGQHGVSNVMKVGTPYGAVWQEEWDSFAVSELIKFLNENSNGIEYS